MPIKKITQGMLLDAFIDRMLAKSGKTNITSDERRELRDQMRAELEPRIERAIIEALPDAKLVELDELLKREGEIDDEVEKFFAEPGVDCDKAVEKVMVEFWNEHVNMAGGQE